MFLAPNRMCTLVDEAGIIVTAVARMVMSQANDPECAPELTDQLDQDFNSLYKVAWAPWAIFRSFSAFPTL